MDERTEALGEAAELAGVPRTTLQLVRARGVSSAAQRDVANLSGPECAALALAEAATRLTDAPGPVPDEVWDDAGRHYPEPQLAALVIAVAAVGAWNRSNIPAGEAA